MSENLCRAHLKSTWHYTDPVKLPGSILCSQKLKPPSRRPAATGPQTRVRNAGDAARQSDPGWAAPQPAGSRNGEGWALPCSRRGPARCRAEPASAARKQRAHGRDGRPSAAHPAGPRPPASGTYRHGVSGRPCPLTRAAGKAGRDAGPPPPLRRGSDDHGALPRATVIRPIPEKPLGARSRSPSAATEDPCRNGGLPARRLNESRPCGPLALPCPAGPGSPPQPRTAADRRSPSPGAADWAGRSSWSKDTWGTTRQPPPSPDRAANGEGPARPSRGTSLAASPRQPPGERRIARDSIRSEKHAISPWAARQWATALPSPPFLIGRQDAPYLHMLIDRQACRAHAAPAATGCRPRAGRPRVGGLCRVLPGKGAGRQGDPAKFVLSWCCYGSRRCWPSAWMCFTTAWRNAESSGASDSQEKKSNIFIFVAFGQRRNTSFFLMKHGRLLISSGPPSQVWLTTWCNNIIS